MKRRLELSERQARLVGYALSYLRASLEDEVSYLVVGAPPAGADLGEGERAEAEGGNR